MCVPYSTKAIEDGKVIRTHQAKEMWGLGTPEDLALFINSSEVG